MRYLAFWIGLLAAHQSIMTDAYLISGKQNFSTLFF